MPPALAAATGKGIKQALDRALDDTDSRIKNTTAAAMIVVAAAYDGAQFATLPLTALPFIGIVLSVILPLLITISAFVTFGIWFAVNGANYFSGKQAAAKTVALFGSLVVEVLPFIDDLPAITAGVITMIVATRIEDAVGNKTRLTRIARRRNRQTKNAALLGGIPVVGTALENARLRSLEKQRDEENRQMAAQFVAGRREVTQKETETASANVARARRALGGAVLGAQSATRTGIYDSWNESQRLRYRKALEARRRAQIAEEDAELEEGQALEEAA